VRNHDYKTANDIIADLADVVSKNGALLLNVSPKPDGTIPDPEQRMLLEIGDWLMVNGEAIYGARPWRVFGEGPTQVHEGAFTDTKREAFTSEDIRFTTKGNVLYAICLSSPQKEVHIKSLASSRLAPEQVTQVQLLGSDELLTWVRDDQALRIRINQPDTGKKPCAFKITLA
jgi:alpha-L-fucosidase